MTEKKRLGRYVTVGGETYGPLDELPDHVAAQITNPAAWERTEATAAAEEKAAKAGRRSGTSSGHRLATQVTVGGETYGPLDELPDHVAARITNPAAWEGGKLPHAMKAGAAEPKPPSEPEPDNEPAPESEPAEEPAAESESAEEPKARRTRRA